ncbi:MAG TPA: twin-arginine translocation signal domain-containing protein [Stellaceae bacterium]|jgi:hypothetical protein|nr:twin-arginine translocation signal domain-containing protein [Stellaceae bacterium]
MRQLDKRSRLTRRRFLQTTGVTAIGVSALATGGVLIDPRGAWAMSLTTLSPDTAKTLVQAARDIYPHDRLAESFYAKAIEPYDAKAAKDKALKDLLTDGAADLDKKAATKGAKSYADLPGEKDRVAILTSISATPFFQKLRGDLITGIYNQPEVWAKLGYEGPSAAKGGYLHRGFNDIDWLQA